MRGKGRGTISWASSMLAVVGVEVLCWVSVVEFES